MFDKIHAALPDTRIFYLGNIPAPIRIRFTEGYDQANQLIQKDIAARPYAHYIYARYIWSDKDGKPDQQFYIADHLHPNPAGYEKLIPVIKAALAESPATQPAK